MPVMNRYYLVLLTLSRPSVGLIIFVFLVILYCILGYYKNNLSNFPNEKYFNDV